MTIEELNHTPAEEKRARIAEMLGATDLQMSHGFATALWPPSMREMLDRLDCDPENSSEHPGMLIAEVPHFERDLNAMHEAEMTLSLGERVSIANNSLVVTAGLCNQFATAMQRADAFLIGPRK